MKNLIFFSVILLFLVGCKETSGDHTHAERDVKQYTIEQFMDNVSVFGGSFSPDGSKVLVSSNKTGIFNVYTIPAAGGEPTPVTESTESSVFAVSYFPEDERILFRKDNNGNEIHHLFIRETDGQVQEITADTSARAIFYGWAHDGKSFFYGYNRRDSRYMDVFEYSLADGKSGMLYEMSAGYEFEGISNDKKYMALTKPINTNDSDLFLYNFNDETMTRISENQAAYSVADFGPDSEALYYLTDDGSEFRYLVRYDLENGARTKELEADWDIWYAYFSHNGKYRVVGINEDGNTAVEITEVAGGNAVDFPKFENGDITSVNISRDETQMSFYVGSSGMPGNLYVYDFATKEARQLTETLNPEIDPSDLVTAKVVRYKSFDDTEIPAIYYRPHQAGADNKVPALVWVHGGPGGQSRQNYHPLIQYLVNHGYAVLAVNNRGSSGYGKTFFQMDDQQHGEGDLQDCIKGKEWLAGQDYIDGDKIGIIGGSYGGFMVMAALTSEPGAFDVGVNLYGVTNWLRTLKSIPPWWESFKDALYKEMGDPHQDSVRLYNISPLFHADQIEKPVMVLQGAQDPRVLQIESDEIVAAVKGKGVPVDYLLFEDEGHGFVKKENQIEAYGKILVFLNEYLKGKPELKG